MSKVLKLVSKELIFFWISSKLIYGLSDDQPLGSPIIPVAPPNKIIGLIFPFEILSNEIKVIKFPICKLAAVGSKPVYALIGFLL